MTIRISNITRSGARVRFDVEYDLSPAFNRQLGAKEIHLSEFLGLATDQEKENQFISLVRTIVQTDRADVEGIVTWISSNVPTSFEES